MTFAFHISREARERYDVEDDLFTITGNVVLPNYAAGRRLAAAINATIDATREPERVVRAGIGYIVALLNPAAAFIKACQGIYQIVMFIVERAKQIADFIDAVLDSISATAQRCIHSK